MTASAKPIVASPFSFTPYKEKEGEEYMNEAQLTHFETILNNWKAELMHEVDRTVHHMQDDAAKQHPYAGTGISIGEQQIADSPCSHTHQQRGLQPISF